MNDPIALWVKLSKIINWCKNEADKQGETHFGVNGVTYIDYAEATGQIRAYHKVIDFIEQMMDGTDEKG